MPRAKPLPLPPKIITQNLQNQGLDRANPASQSGVHRQSNQPPQIPPQGNNDRARPFQLSYVAPPPMHPGFNLHPAYNHPAGGNNFHSLPLLNQTDNNLTINNLAQEFSMFVSGFAYNPLMNMEHFFLATNRLQCINEVFQVLSLIEISVVSLIQVGIQNLHFIVTQCHQFLPPPSIQNFFQQAQLFQQSITPPNPPPPHAYFFPEGPNN